MKKVPLSWQTHMHYSVVSEPDLWIPRRPNGYNVRQGNRPMTEYIRDLRKIAGKLRHWPEQLLIQYF